VNCESGVAWRDIIALSASPNAAFGNSTPLQVIERGESDRCTEWFGSFGLEIREIEAESEAKQMAHGKRP